MKIDGMQNGNQVNNQKAIGQQKSVIKNGERFEKMMLEGKNIEKVGQNKDEMVHEMIDNIEKLKSLLDYDLTVENIEKYKNAVRSFLEYYTKNELRMESFIAKDRKGMEDKLEIIRSVDKKMNDITENMLETNQGHMEVLKKIGEINGLIVNLYV